jgi:glycosyltransferase involved in cell wall biosynthesis
VDGVLAISEALMDELASRGIPAGRCALPTGSTRTRSRFPARPALRASLGFDGRFVVGYVGNLDHRREGIGVMISALDELRRRGRDEVAVLVVGDGPLRAALEAQADRLGLADRCRFTGRVPHEAVPGHYAQMDLFACPRIEERAARYITPLKPYEAMALGIPVLVSDLPARTEIVDPPHRGLAAPTGDPIGLADAIERLVDDATLRTAVAAAGREWVLRERTWLGNGPRYRAAYEAIVGPIE